MGQLHKNMQLKRLTIIGILVFGVTLLLQNCETNDENNALPNLENSESLDLKTVSLQEAKSFFDVKDKELKEKRKNLANKTNELPLEITPNWNSIEHEDLFGIDQAQLTLADANVNRNGKRITKLFFINLNDKIESVIFTLFPNQVDEDGKIIEASFFFVSLSGEFIDGYKIEEGRFARRYVLNEKVVSKASFFMFLQEKECDPFWCDGGAGGQLGTVIVTAHTGNSNGYTGVSGNAGVFSMNNVYYLGQYNSGSGFTGGGGSGGTRVNINGAAGTIYTHAVREKRLAEGETECPDGYINNNGVCEIEFKVDDSQLTGKAKCIYDKLTHSNSNLFKETIGQFIDDPKYNLTLTIGQCSTSDDACTNTANLATTGEIIIKIEDNNANPLQMAQYILHEAIHAELYRFVSRYESGVDPNNRPRLFQLFKYYSELYNIGDIQHIYMTEKYITPIASALRKLDGSKYPLDYYKAFAWDGLRVWDAGNLLNVEMDSKYEDYRKTVIENTTITCD